MRVDYHSVWSVLETAWHCLTLRFERSSEKRFGTTGSNTSIWSTHAECLSVAGFLSIGRVEIIVSLAIATTCKPKLCLQSHHNCPPWRNGNIDYNSNKIIKYFFQNSGFPYFLWHASLWNLWNICHTHQGSKEWILHIWFFLVQRSAIKEMNSSDWL